MLYKTMSLRRSLAEQILLIQTGIHTSKISRPHTITKGSSLLDMDKIRIIYGAFIIKIPEDIYSQQTVMSLHQMINCNVSDAVASHLICIRETSSFLLSVSGKVKTEKRKQNCFKKYPSLSG